MNKRISFGTRQLLPLSALSLLILSQTVSAAIVDNFQTNQGASCSADGNSRLCVTEKDDKDAPHQLSSYVQGNMLTGERDIYIQANDGSTNTSSVRVQGGKFRWSNDTGAESKVVIQWDGKDGEKNGAEAGQRYESHETEASFNELMADGNTDDYTFGGKSSGIRFNIADNELGFDYELLLTDINGKVATIDGASIGNESMAIFNYSDFILDSTGENAMESGFDFTQVDNFQLTLDSSDQGASIDFEIGMIYAPIPEPSHLALFAAGILGASAAGRRHKKQAKQ